MWFSLARRPRLRTPTRREARPARRPTLERLEERLAPATRVWDGGSAVDGNWTTAANWAGDVAPVPGVDDLEFPATAARKANTNDVTGATFLGLHFTGSGYTLGGNAITLGGDLRVDPGLVNLNLNLGLTLDGDRTFQVGSGSLLTSVGAIDEGGGAHGFTKTGVGTLILRGANTYSGLTLVSEGLLRVESLSALGSTAGGTTIAKGAIVRLLNIAGPVTFPPEPLTFGAGPVGLEAKLLNSISDATWSGPVTFELGGNQLIDEPGKVLRFTGVLSGAGGFRHIQGGGILEFAGSEANTYAGATQISRGTLRLHKPAGVAAITGPLNVGGADASAGAVKLLAAEQIANDAAVTLVGGNGFFGTLDLGGFAERIGSLSGNGGHVLLGSAVLTTGSNNSSTVFGGDITGTGGLTKVGTGTFALTGASTYSHPTDLRGGTLRVDGSIISAVAVRAGATLSGSGTTGAVTANPRSKVSPGTGPGILTVAGNVDMGAGSAFLVDLNSAVAGSGYDQLRVSGTRSTVRLGATLIVHLGFAPAGQSFTILDNGGSAEVAQGFLDLAEGAIVRAGSAAFRLSYRGGDGNDVVLTHLIGGAPGDTVWLRQFGSLAPAYDDAIGVAAFDGNVYVVGVTAGTLPGQINAGDQDAFVRKYDASGRLLWTRQFGTSSFDVANEIVADASGVYVVGYTWGTLAGQTSAGDYDAFVRKYDAAGHVVWTRQFGTTGEDFGAGIALDASGVFVTGTTSSHFPGQVNVGFDDVFVRKYDAAGNEVWTRQSGTSDVDIATGIAVDASGVYVVGDTFGTFPGQPSAGDQDAFVLHYDASGTELWSRQIATIGADFPSNPAADGSGVYVAGFVDGTLPGQTSAGAGDAFVRRYDEAGNEIWTRQFGTPFTEWVNDVAVDASGIYVVGTTGGTLPGQTRAGDADAFVREYDTNGNEHWTRQFGTVAEDDILGVAVDASGLYVAGVTKGTFPGQTSAGDYDAFVAKLVNNNLPPLSSLDVGGDGQGAASAPLPPQPAPLMMAVRQLLYLGSAFSRGPVERLASATFEPTPFILVPEALAAAPLGRESGSPVKPSSPQPSGARQVLEEGTEIFLDGALLDELAQKLLGRSKHAEARQPW
jgi:autotransporter-associated beta strand protein